MLTLKEINDKKSKLQEEGFKDWRDNHNARGIFEWATGVGKTRLATHHAIQGMNKKAPYAKIKVVVPKEHLKEDWEGVKGRKGYIQQYNLKNVEVWVINSFVRVRHIADFLIIDEIHRAGNEEAKYFNKVLEVCPARFIMGLSATLSKEQRLFFQERNVPVISTITTREAESQGLISPYKIYNLGIDLTDSDRKFADELHDNFIKFSGKFDGDMKLAMNCSSSTNPRWNPVLKQWSEPPSVIFAKDCGWRGIGLSTAVENYKRKSKLPHGRKSEISVWEDADDDFEFTPSRVQYYGSQYIKYMNRRMDFLHNATKKLEMTEKIVRKFNVPTILFSQRTSFADRIHNILGSKICGVYHSKLESRYLNDKDGNPILYKTGEKAGKPKLFGKKTLKNYVIESFRKFKIKVLSTASALDEGFDVPGIVMAIITSGTGVERQNTQRVGRAVRPGDGKIAVIVNLFVKDSQDEKWLERRQIGDKRPIWIESVNEINFDHDGEQIEIANVDKFDDM